MTQFGRRPQQPGSLFVLKHPSRATPDLLRPSVEPFGDGSDDLLVIGRSEIEGFGLFIEEESLDWGDNTECVFLFLLWQEEQTQEDLSVN